MEGRLSVDPEHPMDVAQSLDRVSMVEWPERPIVTDFPERWPEVARILFLGGEQEGSRLRQSRLVTPTVRSEDSQGFAFSCRYFNPRICKVQDKSTFNACGERKGEEPYPDRKARATS